MNAGDVIRQDSCGCTVEGRGSIFDPLRVRRCRRHDAARELLEALEAVVEDWADAGGTEDVVNPALVLKVRAAIAGGSLSGDDVGAETDLDLVSGVDVPRDPARCLGDGHRLKHHLACVSMLVRERDEARGSLEALVELAKMAWALLANVDAGVWEQDERWKDAAGVWRDDCHRLLSSTPSKGGR